MTGIMNSLALNSLTQYIGLRLILFHCTKSITFTILVKCNNSLSCNHSSHCSTEADDQTLVTHDGWEQPTPTTCTPLHWVCVHNRMAITGEWAHGQECTSVHRLEASSCDWECQSYKRLQRQDTILDKCTALWGKPCIVLQALHVQFL